MTLAGFSVFLASLGVVWTAALGAIYVRNPSRALVITTHHLEDLPKVMAGRYFAMMLLALGAVLYGDFTVIAYLFAVFSFLGFADAWIYHRAGKRFALHLSAGVMAIIVAAVALLALNTGVSA